MSIRLQDAVAEKTQVAMEYLIEAATRVPEERRTWQPMGDARTVLDMIQECGRVNARWAQILRRGEWVVWPEEEIESLRREHDTFEKAVSYLKRATEEFNAAVRETPDDRLDAAFSTPWREATVAHWLMHALWHMSYHEGQINYIQTLYGDWEM